MRRYSLQKYSLSSNLEYEIYVSASYIEEIYGRLSEGEDTTYEASVKRYSLQKYSLPNRIESRAYINTNYTENISGLLGAGADTILETSLSERMNGSVNLVRGISIKSDLHEDIKSVRQLVNDFPFSLSLKEDITSICRAYKNILIVMGLSEILRNNLFMGKNITVIMPVSELISIRLLIGIDAVGAYLKSTFDTNRVDGSKGNHSHSVTVSFALPGYFFDFTIPEQYLSFNIPGQSISFTIPGQDLSLSVPSHTHANTPGIFRFGNPSSFTLYVDGVYRGYHYGTDKNFNLTSYLTNNQGIITRGAWHSINIVPNDLAYISIDMYTKGFIQSLGTVKV